MKIVVLMGGYSAEREISLQSGKAVLNSLKKQGFDCFSFDLTKDNLEELWLKDFDKVFIMLHGKGGEDGFIQKECEKRNISYTGSDSQSSKLAIDKFATKEKWLIDNLPTAQFTLSSDINPTFTLPWAVKPALEGSSIGIHKVTEICQLDDAIKDAKKYDNKIMIEQWIEGEEYTVTILNNKILPVIKLQTQNTFYDYDAKYNSNDTKYICPCGLSVTKEKELQDIALRAFDSVKAKTWARVDIILDEQQKPYLLEINTVPGMTTAHSLVPMAAKAVGIDFEQLTKQILYG